MQIGSNATFAVCKCTHYVTCCCCGAPMPAKLLLLLLLLCLGCRARSFPAAAWHTRAGWSHMPTQQPHCQTSTTSMKVRPHFARLRGLHSA
jgi:hypothetical protein